MRAFAQLRGVAACRAASGTVLAVGVAALLTPKPQAAAPGAVGLDVFAEVVAAHKALVADGAGEALLASVGAQVALQLVGAGEALAAEEPVADEGPLARVPAQVRFEVGCLAVDLAAARDVAAVQPLAPQAGPRGSQPLRLLAVGAVTGGPARVAPSGGRGAWRAA